MDIIPKYIISIHPSQCNLSIDYHTILARFYQGASQNGDYLEIVLLVSRKVSPYRQLGCMSPVLAVILQLFYPRIKIIIIEAIFFRNWYGFTKMKKGILTSCIFCYLKRLHNK